MNSRENLGYPAIKLLKFDEHDKQSGFNILELMFVILIVSIAITLAIPSFNSIIQNNRIENESFRLFSMLRQTRSNAISMNRRNFLCRSSNALNNDNGNGAACRTGGTDNFDWNLELISYALLTDDPQTVPNNRFNNQKLQNVGAVNDNATKQQMLQNIRGSDSDNVTVVASSNDNVFAFARDGSLLNNAPIRIAVCDDRDDPEEFGKLITINAAGLIRLTNTDATDDDLDCTPNT